MRSDCIARLEDDMEQVAGLSRREQSPRDYLIFWRKSSNRVWASAMLSLSRSA